MLAFQTTSEAQLKGLGTMENVPVGVGKAPFDAQVTVGIGAFALYGERMPVVLLHCDVAVEEVE